MRTWVWRIKKASLWFVSIFPEKSSIQDWTLLERSPVLQGETNWEIQSCSNRVEQEAMKSLISENLEEFLMRKVRDIDNVLAPPSPLFAPPHLTLLLFTLPFSSPPSSLPSCHSSQTLLIFTTTSPFIFYPFSLPPSPVSSPPLPLSNHLPFYNLPHVSILHPYLPLLTPLIFITLFTTATLPQHSSPFLDLQPSLFFLTFPIALHVFFHPTKCDSERISDWF